MGVVGPQFVAGTAALAFLLIAEVLASPGAVSESALVYIARHRNLMISIGVLAFQIALSFALILAMRVAGVGRSSSQAAGVAVALMVALAGGIADQDVVPEIAARRERQPVPLAAGVGGAGRDRRRLGVHDAAQAARMGRAADRRARDRRQLLLRAVEMGVPRRGPRAVPQDAARRTTAAAGLSAGSGASR